MSQIKAKSYADVTNLLASTNPKYVRVGEDVVTGEKYAYKIKFANPFDSKETRDAYRRQVGAFFHDLYITEHERPGGDNVASLFNYPQIKIIKTYLNNERNFAVPVVTEALVKASDALPETSAPERNPTFMFGKAHKKPVQGDVPYTVPKYDFNQHIGAARRPEFFEAVAKKPDGKSALAKSSKQTSGFVVDEKEALRGLEHLLLVPHRANRAKPAGTDMASVNFRRMINFSTDKKHTNFPERFNRHSLSTEAIEGGGHQTVIDLETWVRLPKKLDLAVKHQRNDVSTYQRAFPRGDGTYELSGEIRDFTLDSMLSDADNLIGDLSDGKQVIFVRANLEEVATDEQLAENGAPKAKNAVVPEEAVDALATDKPRDWVRILLDRKGVPLTSYQAVPNPYEKVEQKAAKRGHIGFKDQEGVTRFDYTKGILEETRSDIPADIESLDPKGRIARFASQGTFANFGLSMDSLRRIYSDDRSFGDTAIATEFARLYPLTDKKGRQLYTPERYEQLADKFKSNVYRYLTFTSIVTQTNHPDVFFEDGHPENNKHWVQRYQQYEAINRMRSLDNAVKEWKNDLPRDFEAEYKAEKETYVNGDTNERFAARERMVTTSAIVRKIANVLNECLEGEHALEREHEKLRRVLGDEVYSKYLRLSQVGDEEDGDMPTATRIANNWQTIDTARQYRDHFMAMANRLEADLHESFYAMSRNGEMWKPSPFMTVTKPDFGVVRLADDIIATAAVPSSSVAMSLPEPPKTVLAAPSTSTIGTVGTPTIGTPILGRTAYVLPADISRDLAEEQKYDDLAARLAALKTTASSAPVSAVPTEIPSRVEAKPPSRQKPVPAKKPALSPLAVAAKPATPPAAARVVAPVVRAVTPPVVAPVVAPAVAPVEPKVEEKVKAQAEWPNEMPTESVPVQPPRVPSPPPPPAPPPPPVLSGSVSSKSSSVASGGSSKSAKSEIVAHVSLVDSIREAGGVAHLRSKPRVEHTRKMSATTSARELANLDAQIAELQKALKEAKPLEAQSIKKKLDRLVSLKNLKLGVASDGGIADALAAAVAKKRANQDEVVEEADDEWND